ncbi:MAG: hypothetical protein HUU60_00205 [Armatimonadetes bacterium]|nr:hypothetical protein [Armatimonadota bacterium]
MRPARKYQYDAVEEALQRLGGYAALADIYREALKTPGIEWGTQTPFASIRRIVQKMPDRFFRIRSGVWGLVDQRQRIEGLFGAEAETPTPSQSEFTHTFYQGLVVELGKLKQYQTYVPAQDKNRSFKGATLVRSPT